MTVVEGTLGELVKRLADGRSDAQLAVDCGGVPSRPRINQIVNHPMQQWPSMDVIHGLAKGLRVAPETIVLASANSLGFRLQEPSRLARLLPPSDDLTDEQVNAVLAVVRAMNQGHAAGD
jgi:hypothetical protein